MLAFPLFVFLVAFAGVATYTFAVQEKAIPMTTTIASFAWIYLGLVGNAIQRHALDGTPYTIQVGSLQWFFTAMGVLSFGALILWYFGEYPQNEDGDPTLTDSELAYTRE